MTARIMIARYAAGVYDRAVAAIELAKARGFRVNINCTLFDTADPERIARFFDDVMDIGIDGITVSPGYTYERAPDQEHFLNRRRTKELFREIFKRDPRRRWSFNQSSLFLDFLAGNQILSIAPHGATRRETFRLAAPLLSAGRGYAKTFKELMRRPTGTPTAPAITKSAPIAWCIAGTRRPR